MFEGCKFCCFCGQMVIHEIFILEISLVFVNGETDSATLRSRELRRQTFTSNAEITESEMVATSSSLELTIPF